MAKHYIIPAGSLDGATNKTSDASIIELLNEINLPQGGEGIIRYADENDKLPLALFDDEYDNVIPREEADALLELAQSTVALEDLAPASTEPLTQEMTEAYRRAEEHVRYNLQFEGVSSEAIDIVEIMIDNVLIFNDTVTINSYKETSWGSFNSEKAGVYALRPDEFKTVVEYLRSL